MASSSSSSSSSIFSTRQWTYDVFLSFSGVDTRNTATDFMYFALKQKGIYTFMDDKKLEKGKTIESELFKAIKESRFAVVIFSKNYACSTWCLNELVEIVACENMGLTILPIFNNVDPSDVRKQKGIFAQPFDEYEKQFEEKVGTWRAALYHVANIAGYHVDNSPLSDVVESIASLISRNSSCTFSEVTEGLVGIDSQVVELGSCLALWLDDDVRFIGIWAMGGMGKTTLARVAYKMVCKKFEECCIIYNVREKCETAGGLLSLQKYLISQISKETDLNIENVYDGVHMIRKRLSHKRILLVLDDVDESNKLKMLVRKSNCFGPGSRVIITTRNKQLLKEFPVDEIYEVKSLNYKDALRLFCSNAFKREPIPNEYLELSKDFLEYAGGLPLALEVLGSSLFGKSIDEWKNALEMLKQHSEPAITRVLKVSYVGLQESVQEIFKDIACFFNHEDRDHVVKILNELGRYPVIGLSNLIDKSLLKISENNVLWMHDLVRDMGRNIVYQESPDEPGRRSRLWDHKDINHVLKKNTGTEEVKAMDFRGAEVTSIYHEEKEASCGWVLSALPREGLALLVTLREWIQRTLSSQGLTSSKEQKGPLWNPNAFLKMPNIKFMRIRNICPQHVPKYLSNNLRYLEWSDYPSKSLPCFQPDELVELSLPRSKIELLWRGMKVFECLKSIDMVGSSNLIIAPNFNGVPNLEKLVLFHCSNLRKLHPSIGKLKKLKLLLLAGCRELTSLPDKFEMESLVTLDLAWCSKVKKIPEFVGNIQELLLESTAIKELPSSVECLTGLNILDLQDCKNLVCLPNSICSLTSLNNIDLSYCSKFDKLPEDLGNITCLKELVLSETAIKELPSTICSLKSLRTIALCGCSKFDKLPEDLGNITSLEDLNLSETAIKELPSSVEFLIGLISLNLKDCKNFVLLPSTVCNLKSLNTIILSGCSKFDKLPENLGNLECLHDEPLFGGINGERYPELCFDGTAIEVLPSSIGRLAALWDLNLKDCKNLVCLPSTICNFNSLYRLDLAGCSKFANLPEDLGNMTTSIFLKELLLGGTAIKELPSSTIHIKWLDRVSLKGCQLSSSSLTSMPCSQEIDLSDCNLSAIPSGIDRISMSRCSSLLLRGNDFVYLPESISQFSVLNRLYLDGCKSLRSLSNIQIPSNVWLICVDNCTSLERLPEPPEQPNDFFKKLFFFTVLCFNCFKLASNIQNLSNMFQVQSGKQFEKCYIIPGREIPKWFEKVNICDTSVDPSYHLGPGRAIKKKKFKIQLPGSGCDGWRGIVLCAVFLPPELHHWFIRLNGCRMGGSYSEYIPTFSELRYIPTSSELRSEYGKVESHHLWLQSVSKNKFLLPKTPGRSIDKKGFHQVELEIETDFEVEKIGFRVV